MNIANSFLQMSARIITINNKRFFSPSLACNNFVSKIRLQQKLKEAIELPKLCYTNGQYAMFISSRQLVLLSEKNQGHELVWRDFAALSTVEPDFINVMKNAVLLCVDYEKQCKFAFEVEVNFKEKMQHIESMFKGNFINIRTSLFTLSIEDSALVSQSQSLLQWTAKAKFCCECGEPLIMRVTGTCKCCPTCHTTVYPTISPVGISLITNEANSHVLLVRQPSHPPKMFTCIAGFIETGESFEDNVHREVAEEVGLTVKHIEYISSQHWAFPASRLMLGCIATVSDDNFVLDGTELQAAKWFSAKQVATALHIVRTARDVNVTDLWVPPRGAIAHSLIGTWLVRYHQQYCK